MACELDHIFICTAKGAPEAAAIVAFGLTEGQSNSHPGQGTACRRFFFGNAYLELLWVENPAEAQSEPIRPTNLWQRWTGRGSGACPIGLCFRPPAHQVGRVPFSTWEYHPPYLPDSMSLHVGTNVDVLTEPMLCCLPFAQRPDSSPRGQRPSLDHALGLREITSVEIVSPQANSRSAELEAVTMTNLVRLRAGREYLVEIGFDEQSRSQGADFRPELPLIFRW